MDLNGRLIYCNPAAERMLGYRVAELMESWGKTEILAPGESERLVTEIQKLCNVDRSLPPTPAARMAAYLDCVRTLPPSMVPSFDTQVRRKDGGSFRSLSTSLRSATLPANSREWWPSGWTRAPFFTASRRSVSRRSDIAISSRTPAR